MLTNALFLMYVKSWTNNLGSKCWLKRWQQIHKQNTTGAPENLPAIASLHPDLTNAWALELVRLWLMCLTHKERPFPLNMGNVLKRRGKANKVTGKSMVGRRISYWNKFLSGDVRLFLGVFKKMPWEIAYSFQEGHKGCPFLQNWAVKKTPVV